MDNCRLSVSVDALSSLLFQTHPEVSQLREKAEGLTDAAFYERAWERETTLRAQCLNHARAIFAKASTPNPMVASEQGFEDGMRAWRNSLSALEGDTVTLPVRDFDRLLGRPLVEGGQVYVYSVPEATETVMSPHYRSLFLESLEKGVSEALSDKSAPLDVNAEVYIRLLRPLRGYPAIARACAPIEQLPDGALPIYDKDPDVSSTLGQTSCHESALSNHSEILGMHEELLELAKKP